MRRAFLASLFGVCVIAGAVIAYRVGGQAPKRDRPWYSRWSGLLAIFAAFTFIRPATLTIFGLMPVLITDWG